MRLYLLLLFLITCSSLSAISQQIESKILYLIHKKEVKEAFLLYQEERHENHDFALLQKAALTLLEEGMNAQDQEVKTLSLIGAGVALNKHSLSLLKKGLTSQSPEHHLAALKFLSRFDEDEALDLIKEALSSPFLIIRLEAALMLALKQEEIVIDHLHSFYGKIPQEARVFFPQILSEIDSPASTQFLKQLLSETDSNIRIATILHAALKGRDDLLPKIRTLAKHPGYPEEEAIAFAFGKFKDVESKEILKKLSTRNAKEVKLAALIALTELGDETCLKEIIQEALEGNLFAIASLGEFPDKKEVIDALHILESSPHFDRRLNATFSLLKMKEMPNSLETIKELLLADERSFVFRKTSSPGKSMSYWKQQPFFSKKKDPLGEEETQEIKHAFLTKTVELPEDFFLEIASFLFEKSKKGDLIPLLVELLSNHRTEKTIKLLEEKQMQAGAPLTRAYATLALFRLNQDPKEEKKLLQFICSEKEKEMFSAKNQEKEPLEKFSLNTEERSSFLINAFDALNQTTHPEVIDTLIDAIAHGHPKNRYPLAGLLIRMTE